MDVKIHIASNPVCLQSRMMVRIAKIYSRIGELLQGFLPDGDGFLVSGPVSTQFYSEAILLDRQPGEAIDVLPDKTSHALHLLLDTYQERKGHPLDFQGKTIRLSSNIRRGKGLSSSSADILSVLAVVNAYCEEFFSREELYRIAARIEPTDPCLSEGVVLFRQQQGIVERSIPLPPFSLHYFDAAPDREVDTLTLLRSPGQPVRYALLLEQFIRAAEDKDYGMLFTAVTESAILNQEVMALPRFEIYLKLAEELDAGLMIAHSGTMVGFLVQPNQSQQCRTRLNHHISATIYSEEYL